MRTVFALSLATLLLPGSAAAACSCVNVARPEAPRPQLWPPLDAPVLFAGRVLVVDTVARARRVRFVTDSSWRTALPDTVTVEYGDDAFCAHFTPGALYLVGAVAAIGALRLPPCGEGVWLRGGPLLPQLRALGAPKWRALPTGQRQLDRIANRLGIPAPPVGAGDTLFVLLHTDSSAVRLEIANLVPSLRLETAQMRLPPGLYRYRVTRTDGTVLESYVVLRCELPSAGGECGVGRNFLGRE